MAYFSNGDEGMDYQERYCDYCVHYQNEEKGCPVLGLHFTYNYQEANNKGSFLHTLIPRSPDGLSNEKCAMWIEVKP